MNSSSSRQLSGLTILLLEDEPLIRKQLLLELTQRGARVFETTTLLETRRILREIKFDLALIDVNLPDGNSIALLHEQCFPTGTEVIVMTSESSLESAHEVLTFGALHYLAKPFEIFELLEMIPGR